MSFLVFYNVIVIKLVYVLFENRSDSKVIAFSFFNAKCIGPNIRLATMDDPFWSYC